MTLRARDLFAGTGWGVACQRLGIQEHGWEIMPEARATRALHGMHTAGHDVREVSGHEGDFDIEIGSPSCKRYSMTGNGAGRRALQDVLLGVLRYANGQPMTWAESVALIGDEDAALTLEPLRVALDSSARYLVWEQTPAVMPIWDACAEVLRSRGWSAVTSVLRAEQYGVPQTRRRAVLLARRDGIEASMPAPTHSRYHTMSPERLDPGVKPWVSMAEALGWTAGGLETISNYGTSGDPRNRGTRTDDQPSSTITSKADRVRGALRNGNQEKACERSIDRPSGTLFFGQRANWCEWVPEGGKITIEQAATLQTYPNVFTFAGTKGRQFEQVGNAVPPLLAEALLSMFL